jgi:MFS family permease
LEDARASLLQVRSEENVDVELATIVTAVAYEKASNKNNAKWWAPCMLNVTVESRTTLTCDVDWALIREPSLLRRILIVIFLNGGQQICGSSSLNAYATLIYKQVFSDDNTIFLINALSASFNILFTLTCTVLVDRTGRRFMLYTGAAGMALSLLVVAIIGMKAPVNAEGLRLHSVGIAVAAMFFLFNFFYKPSWGATVWIYTSEIFSTDVRAHGVAVGAQTQSVVSTILNQFFPTFLASCGFYTFFFFFGINFMMFCVVWL